MTETAVLDRIEEQQHAVLLVGPSEEERILPASKMPQGCKPGDWLILETDEKGQVTVQLDPEASERATKRIQDKLSRLKQRGRKLS